GLELGLFAKLPLEADYFTEHRRNIFARRITSSTLGLEADVFANIGETKGRGIDGRLIYNDNFANGMWIQGMANFTYATNKVISIEEPRSEERRVGKECGSRVPPEHHTETTCQTDAS